MLSYLIYMLITFILNENLTMPGVLSKMQEVAGMNLIYF